MVETARREPCQATRHGGEVRPHSSPKQAPPPPPSPWEKPLRPTREPAFRQGLPDALHCREL